MKKTKKVFQHNFWKKKKNEKVSHTAQSVLGLPNVLQGETASGCGSGSCNCGGGCNGECGSCH